MAGNDLCHGEYRLRARWFRHAGAPTMDCARQSVVSVMLCRHHAGTARTGAEGRRGCREGQCRQIRFVLSREKMAVEMRLSNTGARVPMCRGREEAAAALPRRDVSPRRASEMRTGGISRGAQRCLGGLPHGCGMGGPGETCFLRRMPVRRRRRVGRLFRPRAATTSGHDGRAGQCRRRPPR